MNKYTYMFKDNEGYKLNDNHVVLCHIVTFGSYCTNTVTTN